MIYRLFCMVGDDFITYSNVYCKSLDTLVDVAEIEFDACDDMYCEITVNITVPNE